MRSLKELIDHSDPAMPLVRQWVANAARPVELLAPSDLRDEALYQTQVTTRSPMGAIVYETGGILVDHGWLRILGSGHSRLTRTLPGWNRGRSSGFYLVADDAVGGFFAVNGGALGTDPGNLYHFAPDSLKWEPLGLGYSAFLQWAFSQKYTQFCIDLRWPGWESAIATLSGDRCVMTYPPLWTKESANSPQRFDVPVEETWRSQMDVAQQLNSK
jgi:hypothetical protein